MKNTNFELRDLDLENDVYISIHELSQVLNAPVDTLKTICLNKHIGMLTSDNHIYIINDKSEGIDIIKTLKAYIENINLEEDVMSYIQENQPTTTITIANALGFAREVIMRVLVEITHEDVNLWEQNINGVDYLYYFDEDYSKWET